jgi:hypothetical protein
MLRRAKVLSNIKTLHELIGMAQTEGEKAVYRQSLTQEVSALERINKEHGATAVAYKRQTSKNNLAEDVEVAVVPGNNDFEIKPNKSEDYC